MLVTANLGAEASAAILEKARPRMEELAGSETPPFIYRIAKDGSLRRIESC